MEMPALIECTNKKLSENVRNILIRNVISYYKNSGRYFPWRNISDPYVILVTEIMLRKTTAKKLILCWSNFFDKYPNIDELKSAVPDEVEAIIYPLGLQKQRAKDLIIMAIQISDLHESKIPDTYGDLINIHGIGPYAANATLCFAFKKLIPIIDVNIARIYSRLFDMPTSKNIYSDRKFFEVASYILPKRRLKVVEFNYGLLDFGAQVCRAVSPKCFECSFNKFCSYKNCADDI